MLRFFKKYYPVRNIFFVLAEGLIIYASILLAVSIIMGKGLAEFDYWVYPKALLITLVSQACLYYNDLYEFKSSGRFTEMSMRLLMSLGVAAILLAFIYLLFPDVTIGKGIVTVSICFSLLIILSWRYFYAWALNQGLFNQNIILLGSAELIKKINEEIHSRKDSGYSVIAEIPERIAGEDENASDSDMLCGKKFEGLADIARTLGARKIIAEFKEKRRAFPLEELLKCRMEGIEVMEGNSFYEMLTGKLYVKQIHPSWLIFSKGFQKSFLRRFFKRVMDVLLAFVMLIVFSPVMLVVALLIKLDSKGPVFYSQERVGEKGRQFNIHKFRSMVAGAEKMCGPVWAEDNDERVTRVGRFIRRWRFDELPQLWNVLKGDMSFVGPRPERRFFVEELERSIPYYAERLSVKPGITGWAQISYGYGATVEDAVEKLNYELFYIKNMSIFMDMWIVLRTIKIVLFGTGAR